MPGKVYFIEIVNFGHFLRYENTTKIYRHPLQRITLSLSEIVDGRLQNKVKTCIIGNVLFAVPLDYVLFVITLTPYAAYGIYMSRVG